MKISKRLKAIADLVTEKRIADIGTDHAYLPIFLSNRLDKAIACDINEGPLKIAKANISGYGLDNIIETRLGDGVQPLRPGEVDCAVIAGMGGMQIVTILKDGFELVSTLSQMVLQPQHDIPEVRRYIHSIGFRIASEVIIHDGKYYNIINCQKGQDLLYNEYDYLVGKPIFSKVAKDFYSYMLNMQIAIREQSRLAVSNKDNRADNLISAYTKRINEIIERENAYEITEDN